MKVLSIRRLVDAFSFYDLNFAVHFVLYRIQSYSTNV